MSKRWSEMSGTERTGGIVGLLVIGGTVFVVIAGIVSALNGSPKPVTEPSDTTTASTSVQDTTPVLTKMQQMRDWSNTYSYITDDFTTDFTNLTSVTKTGNIANTHAACTQLHSDVVTAQGFPAIPDAQTASDFSSALAYFAQGSQDCMDGTANIDASLIEKGWNEIGQGSAKEKDATNDIQALLN